MSGRTRVGPTELDPRSVFGLSLIDDPPKSPGINPVWACSVPCPRAKLFVSVLAGLWQDGPSVAEQWSAHLALAGEPWQRFGDSNELTPSTLHRGQSAASAGPAEGLIVLRGL